MQKIIISLACVLFMGAGVYGQKTKKVFFLAGQSNMEGRADADKISSKDLARLDAVKDRVQFYYNNKKVSSLQTTIPPKYIQKKFSLKKVFGPELFFGIALAEKFPNEEFIFIKRSRGGTSLYGCWNPEWTKEKAALMNELKQPKLYFEFLDLVHKTLDPLPASSYKICGMLWVQGESDSGEKRGPLPSETYGNNLSKLIKGIRQEFQIMEMPFLLFQVGGGKVLKSMKTVAMADANVKMIPQSQDKKSKDYYQKNPKPLGHYVTASMKKIGLEFFNFYETNFASNYFK
ncbi:sialate O-acetylesterase [Bacteroidota bacterium]